MTFDDANGAAGDQPAGIQLPDALLAAAEAAINAVLALDPEGAARLAAVQGRVLRVHLEGFGTRIDIIPAEAELRLFGDYASPADCTVRGTPVALLGLALAARQEDAVFHGQVSIDGDNRVAQTIGEVLRGLDIDWEEQLARLVGDGLAHRIGEQARAGGRWTRRSGDSLAADIREYLIEEGRLLPSDPELRAFLDGVDTLRDDVERCEARLTRLAKRLGAAVSADAADRP